MNYFVTASIITGIYLVPSLIVVFTASYLEG